MTTSPSRCRSCEAPIQWALTIARRLAPVDAEPVDDGNVKLWWDDHGGWNCLTLAGPVLDEARAEGLELHRNHFSTCPHRHRHRHAVGLHDPLPKPSIDTEIHPGQVTIEELLAKDDAA